MNYNQIFNLFFNLSCYEEFEIQCALTGISKIDILRKIGHNVNDYYFLVSSDGIFNWFDLNGNHVEDPGVLKSIREKHIPETITKCVIPNSVTSIGDYAFSYCKSLSSITIPNSVTSIGYGAFSDCNVLTSVTIPDSVTIIGNSVFRYCISLKEVIIPDSVTSICNTVFYSCTALKEITIPNSVTSIGYWVFSDCISLKEVIFKGKTLEEVKQMNNYPFGIKDESIIKCEI